PLAWARTMLTLTAGGSAAGGLIGTRRSAVAAVNFCGESTVALPLARWALSRTTRVGSATENASGAGPAGAFSGVGTTGIWSWFEMPVGVATYRATNLERSPRSET